MTKFSEKVLISTRCIHGFMSNLIKKSWTDSTQKILLDAYVLVFSTEISHSFADKNSRASWPHRKNSSPCHITRWQYSGTYIYQIHHEILLTNCLWIGFLRFLVGLMRHSDYGDVLIQIRTRSGVSQKERKLKAQR